ncbi:LysR family transcriptional regulator [Halomonas sp. SpR8]|uniref:LysR family transcriptional regulator n=1 Tax=Halomonas sp. SpR8 TaxID=3050463 RepID=UPI0027E4C7A4|nr:LysR family transcriptional regulator [Halomonas sp. SpR8]MDQ7728510.1 LysR family transcriptional regulator [Halomonas sp. SpR8]
MTDLIILRDFLALCETKSFNRTAEHRHVSVSGLSRRIQGLEEWAGTALFERRKGALVLTDAGHRLQTVASQALSSLDCFRRSVADDINDQKQRIRFCSPHIMATMFFPQWLPRLQEQFTRAKFSIDSNTLPECLTALNQGETDFVTALFDCEHLIARRLGVVSDSYASIELDTEYLIPVSAPNVAGQSLFNLHVTDGSPLSFLNYSQECHLEWSLSAMLAQQDLNLQQHHDAGLADSLRHMTLSKLGVAWLPYSLVREDLAAKRLVRAGSDAFDVPLNVVLLRRTTPLPKEAQRLWDGLLEVKNVTAFCDVV